MAEFFALARSLNKSNDRSEMERLAASMYASGDLLGLLGSDPEQWFAGHVDGEMGANEIEALLAERNKAKAERDFQRADAIRDQLKDAGIAIQDSREGTSWRRDSNRDEEEGGDD
jgi:cysteinyl-tRNA synthetase